MSILSNCYVRLTLFAIAAFIALATAGCKRATPIPDAAPRFTETAADQGYTAGQSITPLVLPAASGGNGALTYSVRPVPPAPGLTFNPGTRTLSGTATTAGYYNVEYSVATDGRPLRLKPPNLIWLWGKGR